MKYEIYLAGGCFWGIEKYLKLIKGVTYTEVGYANGKMEHPTYEDVCRGDTEFVETVKVEYDSSIISLSYLLELYFDSIDPTSVNQQGGDIGTQYRTGIYYTDASDASVLTIIEESIKHVANSYDAPIVTEVLPLSCFYTAETYHQNYLDKNPSGYCHIGPELFAKAKKAVMSQ